MEIDFSWCVLPSLSSRMDALLNNMDSTVRAVKHTLFKEF